MDMNAAVKIAATVTGTQAVDDLRKSIDGVSSSVNGTTERFSKFAGSIKGLAAAIGVVGLAHMVSEVIKTGDEMYKLSQKTGVSVEALSTFKMAGKLSGVEIEQLGKALVKFDVAISKANTGNKEAAAAFAAVGINAKSLKGLNTENAVLKVADAFSKTADGAAKTRVAVELFGKAGADMIPLLNMGSEEIEKLGVKMSTDFAARSQQFNDSMTIMQAKMKIFTVTAVSAVMPSLQEIANAFLDVSKTKPDVTSFFDVVGEAARQLAFIINGAWSALKVLGNTAVDMWKIGVAIKNGDTEGIKAAWNDIGDYANKVEGEFNKTRDRLQKNSLMNAWFGDESVAAVKARQMADTMPTRPLTGKGGINEGVLNTAGSDKFQSAMNDMGGEAAKLAWQSAHVQEYADKITNAKAAQMAFDTEFGKFKDLSAAQKSQLMDAARSVDKYGASLKAQLAALDYQNATDKINAETAAIGMNDTARKIMLAGLELEQKGIKKNTDLYDQLMAKRVEALKKANETQRDFGTASKKSFDDYLDDATNWGKQIGDVTKTAFKGMEDSLVSFVMTGKLEFNNFITSILSGIARMIIQETIMAPIVQALKAMIFSADGNVFSGGAVQAFANGGVVSGPTAFPISGGKVGVMGEAGPEAIMPLKRDSSGRLGVATNGGAGGGSTNITVNVATDGSTSSKGDGTQSQERLGRIIAGVVRQELVNQKRPGGLLAAGAMA